MAKEKTPAAPPPDAAAAPQKKKRSKWLLIAPVLVVALAGTGAGIWYWLRPAPAGDHAAAVKEAPKPDKTKPPIFVALETFTVNLQPETGDHLLQTAFSLKVVDATVEQALKLQMPEIRSRLLLLLSSKRPSELISVAGKQHLAGQIAVEVNRVLHPEAADPAASGKLAEKGSDSPSTAAPKAPEDKAAEKAPDKAEKSAEKTPEKAAEKAPEKIAERPTEPAPPAAAPGPVLSVFFTTFIIQ